MLLLSNTEMSSLLLTLQLKCGQSNKKELRWNFIVFGFKTLMGTIFERIHLILDLIRQIDQNDPRFIKSILFHFLSVKSFHMQIYTRIIWVAIITIVSWILVLHQWGLLWGYEKISHDVHGVKPPWFPLLSECKKEKRSNQTTFPQESLLAEHVKVY